MKIVYCIAATSNSGGMERVLTNKANYFAKMGFEVHIVTTDQQGKANFFTLDPRVQQHDLGINYVHNNDKGLLRKLFSYQTKLRAHEKRLTTLLTELQPAVTISMFDHEVPFLWKLPVGGQKVLEIHFSRYKRVQYGRRGLWGMIDRWRSHQDLRYAKKYARFVVLTQEDKRYWGDFSTIRVIPNANSFVPKERADLTQKRVIAVGRYDYQKRFEDLIDLWSTIKKERPDWSLHIYGHGPSREALEQQIQAASLQDVVHLEAPVTDIEKAYCAHSMLAMTSRYEGLPMALLEAQSCGLPLLAYACKCGPRDVIQEGKNGFLLAEGDKAGMAERLLLLMNDESLRQQMGREAKQCALDFSEDVVMKQWLAVFAELHRNKKTDDGTR